VGGQYLTTLRKKGSRNKVCPGKEKEQKHIPGKKKKFENWGSKSKDLITVIKKRIKIAQEVSHPKTTGGK